MRKSLSHLQERVKTLSHMQEHFVLIIRPKFHIPRYMYLGQFCSRVLLGLSFAQLSTTSLYGDLL